MKKCILLLFTTIPSVYFGQITKMESLQSVYVEVYKNNTRLGSASAFIIKSKTQYYLVTNYHVVTNKFASTKQWLDTSNRNSPNKISIWYHDKKGGCRIKTEPLIDKNNLPLWDEDKINNEMVDVIELPLKDTIDVLKFPVKYYQTPDQKYFKYSDGVKLSAADNIYVLGYPLGIRDSEGLPIWKSGTIASEPQISQDNKPLIFVDIVSFHGMSGAPAYYLPPSNTAIQEGQGLTLFIGVFSAELNEPSTQIPVFGILWKATYLVDIFNKLP